MPTSFPSCRSPLSVWRPPSTSGECTVFGDHCIRLRCIVENTGSGRGVVQVHGILSRSEADDLTHGDTATLAPGESRPVILDFRDATVKDPEDALRCGLTPVPRDWRRLLPF